MKGKNVKKLNEIALLKTIIMLCASCGAKKFTLRTIPMRPKAYRLYINMPETAVNIWTDDDAFLNAFREVVEFEEETENERRTENFW